MCSSDLKRPGTQVTLVAYSYALTKALQAAETVANDISVEVVDPRTLAPLDVDTIEIGRASCRERV